MMHVVWCMVYGGMNQVQKYSSGDYDLSSPDPKCFRFRFRRPVPSNNVSMGQEDRYERHPH